MRKTCFTLLSLLLAFVLSASSALSMTLTLSKKFVKDTKNRATLQISLYVDEHLPKPHPIDRSGKDGDIHMAGRSDEVRLPLVAEIMNARWNDNEHKPIKLAVDLLNQSSGKVPIEVNGIWRIWFEHPGPGSQIQGQTVPVPADSNPPHVFEVHPIVTFGEQSLLSSLAPIADDPKSPKKKYSAFDAKTAFGAYEKLTATIGSTATGITITSKKAGYNYVEFILEPAGHDEKTDDGGLIVLANVYDTSDEEEPITERPRRMVFVKDSQAFKEHTAHPNESLHVMGIPRVDLAQVAEIAAVQSGHGEDSVALPYEIVIVGVFPAEDQQ